MTLRLATPSRLPLALIASVALSACVAAASPSPTASPTPRPSGPSGTAVASPRPSGSIPIAALNDAELKIRLIDRLGALWYCDPDYWPVARQDEAALAVQRWPEISADPVTLGVIAGHLGIALSPTPTDAQKLAIYREWKMLRAIALDPVGTGGLDFDYLAMPRSGGTEGIRSKGTIDRAGTITVSSSVRAPEPMCPICLGRGQLVGTPNGPVAVEKLRLGDLVWTRGADGGRIAGVVIALGSAAAPPGHELVRLGLADGSTVLASPGHPLADGRRLAKLRPDDRVDGIVVTTTDRIRYDSPETFDLLPSGPTGAYAVDGIWLASTLRP